MPKPLALAVDARIVSQDMRGIGRYERAILRRLAERDDVALTLLVLGAFAFAQRGKLARALGTRRFSVASRVSAGHALVWHPANGSFFPSMLPNVVTIHDAAPFRFPDPDPARRSHVQDPFLRSVRTLTKAIAVSHFGKSELREMFALPDDRVSVIYHGVDATFAPGPAQPLAPGLEAGAYLLFVGDALGEPRKNWGVLHAAYRRAWPDDDGPTLAVVGPRAPAAPGIVLVDDVGDDPTNERMRALYRGAIALALPSFYEGFGMPAIEAMACGTPVIAARASCLPEIADSAAYFAAPDNADDWAHALVRVTRDARLRAELRDSGLTRARAFNWDACAEQHLALFREVARG